MPRKLERFPSAASSRYPWDELLNGDPWELRQGEDFVAKTSTIIANARAQAKRRGGNVRTRTLVEGGETRVVVQYIAREQPR
jgi:hypothetical protein